MVSSIFLPTDKGITIEDQEIDEWINENEDADFIFVHKRNTVRL